MRHASENKTVSLPQQSNAYDYIEKITEMYSNKKTKATEDDSDSDTHKPHVKTAPQDRRIALINKCDAKHFASDS